MKVGFLGLGAMGLPDVRWPSGVEMAPQLDLRERLDLYCGLRPVYLYHPNDTPLRNRAPGSIDLLLIRESTEGLFWGRKNPCDRSAPEAMDAMRISRRASERLEGRETDVLRRIAEQRQDLPRRFAGLEIGQRLRRVMRNHPIPIPIPQKADQFRDRPAVP